MKNYSSITTFLCGFLLAAGYLPKAYGQALAPSNLPVTNLLQLVQLINSTEHIVRDVQLEATVCAASGTTMGVVILQDSTDTELFEFRGGIQKLRPGDRIRIDRKNCLLRRQEMGVQISAMPTVDNNGIHSKRTTRGGIWLRKGRHSLKVEWFNREHQAGLEVKWQIPGLQLEDIPNTNLFCSASNDDSGQKNIHPGLLAESYEGDWERVPNFDLLNAVKTAVVTNFDVGFATRDKFVAVRFSGYFNAPIDGIYGFSTRSADGSLLFVDDAAMPIITKVGRGIVPRPALDTIDEPLVESGQQPWVTVEGRASSISPAEKGLEMNLNLGRNSLAVRIVDARGLEISNIINSPIRITGVGCNLFNMQGNPALGRIFVASAQEVETIQLPKFAGAESAPLIKVEQVQTLTLEEAKRNSPVHLHGIVTSKGRPQDFWFSAQDDTRGIFVDFRNTSNSVPMCGDFYEIIGYSEAGDFAPIVVADKLVRLGKGELPKPIRPTWDELNNGSMDVQWVEFKGLVTGVHSNMLSMLFPSGEMDVQLEEPSPLGLKSLEKAVVRIRGVLFATWNSTREMHVGSILMRNASIAVEHFPPSDPFDAVSKTPRELLLFDAQATTFRRVKVRGQIVYADPTQAFLQEDGDGLRLLPAENMNLKSGDVVEAVGYPSIGRTELLLREAVIRKIGRSTLLPPKRLTEPALAGGRLDSTRVQIEGKLLGWHLEQHRPVLEMQAGERLFFARLTHEFPQRMSLRSGSSLRLIGVYKTGGHIPARNRESESFELFLDSPDDIKILTEPSWWTLPRLLIVIGILFAVLIASVIWISQLRRLVEQRTRQLHREIREREVVEKQRIVEAERARIARDLHDDLGASLTEISVLASSGQQSGAVEHKVLNLFKTITNKARELVAALDLIVWAVDPKDNSLQSVADYLCDFVDEYLSPSGIASRFDVPVILPYVVLDGKLRHDLFLAVKESLHNIVRHSKATEVQFQLVAIADQLQIVIRDNGKGFGADQARAGKGLKNLRSRLSKIGGNCEIESMVEQGTTIKINLDLSAPTQPESKTCMTNDI